MAVKTKKAKSKKKKIVDDISDETIVVVSEDEVEADLNMEKLNALKKQMESKQKEESPEDESLKEESPKEESVMPPRIVEERTPYVAKNVLKDYDSETTAVIYIVGEKDAGRLSTGKILSII